MNLQEADHGNINILHLIRRKGFIQCLQLCKIYTGNRKHRMLFQHPPLFSRERAKRGIRYVVGFIHILLSRDQTISKPRFTKLLSASPLSIPLESNAKSTICFSLRSSFACSKSASFSLLSLWETNSLIRGSSTFITT